MSKFEGNPWSQMGENTKFKTRTKTRILGKRETKIRLQRSQVPTEPILRVVEAEGLHAPNLVLARMVYRWRVRGYMPFNSADRLLVAAGIPMKWHTELQDLYNNVYLGTEEKDVIVYQPKPGDIAFHGDIAKSREGCKCPACMDAYKESRQYREEREARKNAV